MTGDVAAAMLRDFGAPVVCGSTHTTGRLRMTTETVADGLGGTARVRQTTLSVLAGALGELPQDTPLTHAGIAYLVRGQQPSDDGSLDLIDVVRA